MKRIQKWSALLMAVTLLFTLAAPAALAAESTVTIKTAEDLAELSRNCTLDTWSQGKAVILENDLDLHGVDFTPIPTFSGTFQGNGHTISGLTLTGSGNVRGLFRYIQNGATVQDLTVMGTIHPNGHQDELGLLAGSNAGRLLNCIASGTVMGDNRIGGLVGAGRSELVEGIFGMHPLSSGEIYVKGKKVNVSSPQDIIKEGVALITEDRKVTGLNLSGTVNDNIAMVAIKKLLTNGLYNKSKAYKASQEYIEKLNIKTPSANQIVGNLSGGNQQKVVIAKWLLNEPDIIILDEPTRGIDVGAKRDIYLLLGKLVQQGKAVIMISSEIPELMGICDRVLVMCEGNDSGEVKREDFSQERIMTLASAITV